jgi:hypothetical protein
MCDDSLPASLLLVNPVEPALSAGVSILDVVALLGSMLVPADFLIVDAHTTAVLRRYFLRCFFSHPCLLYVSVLACSQHAAGDTMMCPTLAEHAGMSALCTGAIVLC